MIKMFKNTIFLITIPLLLLLTGCNSEDVFKPSTDSLQRIIVVPTSIETKGVSGLSLAVGNKQSFAAIGYYSDGSSSKLNDLNTSEWYTSDPTIGYFESPGILVANQPGVIDVNVNQGDLSSNILVEHITDAVITDISITPPKISIAKGQTEQLTATATYSDNTSTDVSSSVTWIVEEDTTATISSTGLLVGNDVGVTNVKATHNNISSNTAKITVTEAVLTEIVVTPASITLAKGQTQKLVATGKYSDGTTSDISESVTWSSANTDISKVNSLGQLTANNVGSTTVTASQNSISSNSVKINVTEAVIKNVSIMPSPISIAKGQTQQLKAVAIYSDSTTSDVTNSVTWTPKDAATAIVTPEGLLTGVNVGNTTLFATKGSITSNQVEVKITDAIIDQIMVTPSPISIAKGQTQQLLATAIYSDKTSSDVSDSVSWIVADTDIITVNPEGLLTGTETGITTLSAVKDSVTSAMVNVDVSNAVMTEISVTPSLVKLAKGQTQQLEAIAIYSDGESSDVSHSVSWVSENTNIATVTPNGIIFGIDIGATTLSASKNGIKSNTVNINVTDAIINEITVTPISVSLAKGQKQQLKATATFSDGKSTDISDSVTWLSTDTNTATVTPEGLLSGVNIGTTTLSAIKDGITSNSIKIDVTDAIITEIEVTPLSVDLAKGQTQQLHATAILSDASSTDVTNSVTWIPMDTNTVSITPEGLLSAVEVGITTISATKDSITSNAIDINISDAIMTKISIEPSTVNIEKDDTKQLTAIATFSDSSTLDVTETVTWKSMDTDLATITSNGLLFGVAVGNTMLNAIRDEITSNNVNVNIYSYTIEGLDTLPDYESTPSVYETYMLKDIDGNNVLASWSIKDGETNSGVNISPDGILTLDPSKYIPESFVVQAKPEQVTEFESPLISKIINTYSFYFQITENISDDTDCESIGYMSENINVLVDILNGPYPPSEIVRWKSKTYSSYGYHGTALMYGRTVAKNSAEHVPTLFFCEDGPCYRDDLPEEDNTGVWFATITGLSPDYLLCMARPIE